MYAVKITHMTEAWERGDLSSKCELVDVKHYKTRKEAKAFIEQELSGKKNVREEILLVTVFTLLDILG